MIFENPEFFFLIIPLICIYCYQIFFMKKPKGSFFYSDLNLFLENYFSIRGFLAFLPNLLKVTALILIIFALSRPKTIENKTNQTQKGVDIMIVMDISLSMLIEDMNQMTRLEASKKVVSRFIEGRPNDRIGLIVFSGESFTQVPLTFDHELLKNSLSQVKPLSSIKEGTAIGLALANATIRLKHSPQDSRIIIFLTDGENNRGFIDPETALQIVRTHKIKVHTIGLGSESGSFPVKYEVKDSMGRSSYKRIYVNSQINKTLMKKISSQTDGEFFMAKNLISLEKIFKQIDKIETYDFQIKKWTKYTEHFNLFLITGTILYFVSLFLSITVFFRGI